MADRKILLVEGEDDKHVLMHICGNRDLPHLDAISSHGGVDELLKAIPISIRLTEPGDVFGVVIDADSNLANRWRAVRDQIINAGYPDVPDQPVAEGTILNPPADSRLPRLGIWVMPNNQSPGILENFLQFLIPDGDALLAYAKTCLQNLPERRFIANDEPKAVIHTWLAWQEEPGKPYGTAITARFLDPHQAEADILAEWLRRLFFPDS